MGLARARSGSYFPREGNLIKAPERAAEWQEEGIPMFKYGKGWPLEESGTQSCEYRKLTNS